MTANQSNENRLEEWREIRAFMARIDGYLAELRKYGFSFIAVLLTASAIKGLIEIDKYTRTSIIIMIIIFTLGLHLFDRYYQQLTKTILIRARILETFLNIEMGLAIENRYEKKHFSDFITVLYCFFIVLEAFVGYTVVATNIFNAPDTNVTAINSTGTIATDTSILGLPNIVFWIIVAVAGLLGLILSRIILGINLNPYNLPHKEDWIIDKLSCEQGEKIRITITNLGEDEIRFEKEGKVCEIYAEDGSWKGTITEIEGTTIPHYGNNSWLWDTGKAEEYETNSLKEKEIPKAKENELVPEGIYRIKPRDWNVSLRRSVFVHKKTATQESHD